MWFYTLKPTILEGVRLESIDLQVIHGQLKHIACVLAALSSRAVVIKSQKFWGKPSTSRLL
jgi:hypothetical protein